MSERKMYIGIDPGNKGAISTLIEDYLTIYPLSGRNRYDIRNLIETIADTVRQKEVALHCCIEKVGGFIGETEEGEGNRRNVASAHTMFEFGESYGWLCMALVCNRISFYEVPPREWQMRMRVPKREKGLSKQKWKRQIAEIARKILPEEKITIECADSVMLALFCQERFRE